MFVDTGEIVGLLGKEPPLITTTVSVDIELAREIYERLISQGWLKTVNGFLIQINISSFPFLKTSNGAIAQPLVVISFNIQFAASLCKDG